MGEGLWPETENVSPACTQGEKYLEVFMVILLCSGSTVTTRKASFFNLTHAPALILGSSFSTLPASTPGRKFTISSVVQGHVSGVAGLQVPFAPTPSSRAAWMVSP